MSSYLTWTLLTVTMLCLLYTTGYQTENWDCIVMLIDDQGNEVWKNIFGNPRGYDPKFILDEC